MNNLIVVYGTLKRGYCSDLTHWHVDNRKIKDIILKGWDMYTNGWYPNCIPGDGMIQAELWEVNPECIRELDQYEGHPTLFKRTPVDVEGDTAEMYVFQHTPGGKKIESGRF